MQSRFIYVCICVCGVFLLTSCNSQIQKNIAFESPINAFPKSMVGLWEARAGREPGQMWKFKFEKDGSIKKIDHLVAGPLIINEGGSSGKGPDNGTGYVFVLGPCKKEYNPKTDVLSLEINLDYFEMVLPQGTLSGRQKDTFIGKVSEDGETWRVEWRSYSWLDDALEVDSKEIDENPEKITFKKVDFESLK